MIMNKNVWGSSWSIICPWWWLSLLMEWWSYENNNNDQSDKNMNDWMVMNGLWGAVVTRVTASSAPRKKTYFSKICTKLIYSKSFWKCQLQMSWNGFCSGFLQTRTNGCLRLVDYWVRTKKQKSGNNLFSRGRLISKSLKPNFRSGLFSGIFSE